MTDLAIIIVNWNVRDLLVTCLHSIRADLANSNLTVQIWVVDNGSSDGSVAMLRRDFPEVHLIANDRNLGFAGGNNAALRAIGFSDYSQSSAASSTHSAEILPAAVLLLNPDTELHPGALQSLVDFLRRTPQAGIAGAQLLFGDGSFQHSVFDFPGLWQLAIELLPGPGRLVESRLNGRYPRRLYEQGKPFKVGHPLGAAMCVRREAIAQAGLLDEQYHMYVEEVDWSKRIQTAGWQAYCVPAAKITHLGGQSSSQIKTTSFVNLWRSRRRFYDKHYSPPKVWLARQIVRVGMCRLANQAVQAARRGELEQSILAERLQSYSQVADLWRQAGPVWGSPTQEQETHV